MFVLLHDADRDAEAVIRIPVLQGENGLAESCCTHTHRPAIVVRPADGVGVVFGTRPDGHHLLNGVKQEFHILAPLRVQAVWRGVYVDQLADAGGIEGDAVAGKAHDRIIGVREHIRVYDLIARLDLGYLFLRNPAFQFRPRAYLFLAQLSGDFQHSTVTCKRTHGVAALGEVLIFQIGFQSAFLFAHGDAAHVEVIVKGKARP